MKKTFYNLIIVSALIGLIFSFAGCTASSEKKESAQIFALDTVIDITAYGDKATEAVYSAKAEIYALEKLFSVTDTDSDIYRINASQDEFVKVSEDVYALTEKAVNLHTITEGNFDITLYNVLKLWGFTAKEYNVPSDEDLKAVLDKSGVDKVVLGSDNYICITKDCALDLGGIAKGYIADKASDAMKAAGAEYGIISLGGNIRTFGEKPDGENWIIGIRHPDANEPFITVITKECSVITSGAYQRNFEKDGTVYHHIINPETGKPSDSDAVSVTIIGKDGALCDALSTAVFVGGTEYAENLHSHIPDFEYIILDKDKNVYASEGLKGQIELTEKYQKTNIVYK